MLLLLCRLLLFAVIPCHSFPLNVSYSQSYYCITMHNPYLEYYPDNRHKIKDTNKTKYAYLHTLVM